MTLSTLTLYPCPTSSSPGPELPNIRSRSPSFSTSPSPSPSLCLTQLLRLPPRLAPSLYPTPFPTFPPAFQASLLSLSLSPGPLYPSPLPPHASDASRARAFLLLPAETRSVDPHHRTHPSSDEGRICPSLPIGRSLHAGGAGSQGVQPRAQPSSGRVCHIHRAVLDAGGTRTGV